MTKYAVKYKVAGFGDGQGAATDQQTEPYDTLEIAEEHRRDIAGFEGVHDCRIVDVEVE